MAKEYDGDSDVQITELLRKSQSWDGGEMPTTLLGGLSWWPSVMCSLLERSWAVPPSRVELAPTSVPRRV
jgi:hypothetical protein